MIGYYNSVTSKKRDSEISIDLFLDCIKDGKWQDLVLPIRIIQDKKERTKAKEKLPVFTVSGIFNEGRRDSDIDKHSGFIGIDIDGISNISDVKELLKHDPYVYAAFTTVSGYGICVIIPINPKRHRDDFLNISTYFFEKYQLVVDPTSVNEARCRFVSYDPDILINYNEAIRFDIKYERPKKEKVPDVVYSQNDFDRLINEVMSNRINLCESYYDWLRIGFSLSHQFNESGRSYYHTLSQFSSKYDSRLCDKQYDACLKAHGTNQVTIATLYHYFKESGLQIYSDTTKKISHSVFHGKKGGLTKEQIALNLKKFEGIDISIEEITEYFNSNAKIKEETPIEEIELYIRQNYNLKRNLITRYIENDGKQLEQNDLNTIFINCKKAIPKATYELIERIIFSDFTKKYNPLHDFIDKNRHRESSGNIKLLFDSTTCTQQDQLVYFGTKWLVAMIASIYGEHSPLMLIFYSEFQNVGKTEFFRRLLPKEIKKYYAESKLDQEKDDKILMTQRLIILDDEMGGKSKKEEKTLKEMLSKQIFTLREPYGKGNVDLIRLALLCGTTNDREIIYDTTGNRRLLPFSITNIDHELYNSIDKTDLFMELVYLYESGFNYRLSNEDIKKLNECTEEFEATSIECELLLKYFRKGNSLLTSSDIKVKIEGKTMQKLSLNKLCRELQRSGFEQVKKRIDNRIRRCYLVEEVFSENVPSTFVSTDIDNPPF